MTVTGPPSAIWRRKSGNHAAGGAEDIAEAHGHEPGFARVRDLEGLEIHLGQAFGGAHDAGGVDGLVRGDQDEAVDTVFQGEFGQPGGAEAVVLDGFAGLMLHHGHVFVGGGVEDDVGLVLREDLFHAIRDR